MAKHLQRIVHLLKTAAGHLAKTCSIPPLTPCTLACPIDPDPGCCHKEIPDVGTRLDPAPDTVEVTILAAQKTPTGDADWDHAAPFHIYKVDPTGLIGHTFSIPASAVGGVCFYTKEFDVSGLVKLLRCYGDGSGPGACEPMDDIATSATLVIEVGLNGSGASVTPGPLTIYSTDPEFDGAGHTGRVVPISGPETVVFTDCCHSFSATGASLTGAEATLTCKITSAAVVPC